MRPWWLDADLWQVWSEGDIHIPSHHDQYTAIHDRPKSLIGHVTVGLILVIMGIGLVN